ncbi:MAG: hypothetical protein Q9162_002252 [Coniocarpon cinnabarinum]
MQTAAPRPAQTYAWPNAYSYGASNATSTMSSTPTTTTAVGSDEPCASVASLVAGAASASPTVPAEVAYACQKSVPFDQAAAVPWLESLRPYILWQSTTSYLVDPPEGYLEPASDINGNLNAIISKAQAGGYDNEYDLEFDLYEVFQTTHDGHFRYTPNLVGSIFRYGRTIPLVSVSSDGQALPQVYVYADVLAQSMNSTQASAVMQIDGQDAATYLENLSQFGSLQDPDALYNNLFYELAQISLGSTGTGTGVFGGGGRGAYVYPNATTTLTFANGTTSEYQNFARVIVDFTGIQSGTDLYNTYINPPQTSGTSASTASASATPTSIAAPGYPSPVIRNSQNLVGGYYLNSPGYQDAAILSIPSFVGDGSQEESFQDVVTQFLKQSKTDGKQKLIIDVSANAGGTILQGYDVFKQLFPDQLPYGATRFRAFESTDLIGSEVSDVAGPVYPWDINDPANVVLDDFLGTPFDYRADLNVDYEPFTSWPDKFGPHEFNGDNFTSIIRWNLSDCTSIYTSGIIVTGYCNRTDLVPSRPYAPEDIIIVYDGYCASTCTIFSEFMRQQGNVKTIALGGRPQAGPIQAVGGVKGTNDYPWDFIYQAVNDTFTLAPNDTYRDFLAGTELGEYSEYPLRRAFNNYAVNFRDGIRQGDESQTPLQFVYEPADCRIYYTSEMTVDVTAIWKTVYDSVWGGKSACVVGDVSVGNATATGTKKTRKRNEFKLGKRMDMSTMQALKESIASVWTDVRGMRLGDSWMAPN